MLIFVCAPRPESTVPKKLYRYNVAATESRYVTRRENKSSLVRVYQKTDIARLRGAPKITRRLFFVGSQKKKKKKRDKVIFFYFYREGRFVALLFRGDYRVTTRVTSSLSNYCTRNWRDACARADAVVCDRSWFSTTGSITTTAAIVLQRTGINFK